MIEFQQVHKQLNRFDFELDARFQEQRITGVIGRNGSGKTTLFRLLLGLSIPDEGGVMIQGKNSQDLTSQQREAMVTIYSDVDSFDIYQIPEILSFWQTFYPKFDRAGFLKAQEKFKLPNDKGVGEFSKGMRGTLKVLLALFSNCQLVVMDEPTSGLDVVSREQILTIIQERFAADPGMTILISSHIAGDIEQICDDIYLLDEGKLIFKEDTDVILSDYGVLKVSKQEYSLMDQAYFIHTRPTEYGFSVLTDQRQYYQENYPKIVLEKAGIDDIVKFLAGGDIE